jgi:hypothetical protein
MEFSGRLSAFPVADILQWAQHDRRSGALVVRRSGQEKRVYFRDGAIVACFSDDTAEFFGQHLLVSGRLDEGKLVQALSWCRKKNALLGTALVELGVLPAAEVAAALRQHVEDQVCELFLWRNGIFYFTHETLEDAQVLPEPLPAGALALEGSRRADEHQRIRRLFVHDQVVLAGGRKRPDRPTELERRVLRAVDGRRTLSEVYKEVRGSWYRYLDAAYRLTADGFLDIGDVPDPSESHSTELRLADLLIEQVAEEQSAFLRHHLAIPFDAIARCVPIWVRAPEPGDEPGESAEARGLYERIDGQTSFATLLGGARAEERARHVDRFILQLRKGTLALLPAPLAELEAAPADDASPARAPWWRKLRAAARGG